MPVVTHGPKAPEDEEELEDDEELEDELDDVEG